MNQDIYAQEIIEHYKRPHNKGVNKKADIISSEANLVCGDKVTYYISLEKEKIIEIKFNGEGCAISQATASMLTKFLINKKISYLNKINLEFIIKKLLKIKLLPTRYACVQINIEALKKAYQKYLNIKNKNAKTS